MLYSAFLLLLLSSYGFTQSFDCPSDPQIFILPDDDPDEIKPPTGEDTCDIAIRAALQCNHIFSNQFIQTDAQNWNKDEIFFLNAAAVNGTTVKNVIAETSAKTAEFLGNIAFAMDKAETWREDVTYSSPDSVTRKMMAAKYLAQLNAHNFGAVIKGTETLASSTFTSFSFLGGIGHFLGGVARGVGSILGFGSQLIGGFGGGDASEALRKIEEQIQGLHGGLDGLMQEVKKGEAAEEAQTERIVAILTDEAKKIEADLQLNSQKIDQVLKTLQVNFNNVELNFNKLNNKLDALALSIEKTSVYASYKVNQGRLRDVRQKYNQFVAAPSPMSLQELHEICKSSDPHLALEWIQREVVYDQVGLQLISTILEDVEYDRSKLRQWSKVIISDAMEAMYLREVCVGVRFDQKANSTAEATAFNTVQLLVPILKPENATRVLMSATNSMARFNHSELFYSICNSRKTSGKLFKDIIKTLDTVEQDLLHNFGKVLERDLKNVLAEYSFITPDLGEVYLKPMYDEALTRITNKYYWTKCWLGLTKAPIQIRSGDGSHFAQVTARGMFMTAICAEQDATYPPVDKLVWAQMGQFWNSAEFKASRITNGAAKPDVFDPPFSNYDNLVMATTNATHFLYNTQDPYAGIRSMGTVFCNSIPQVPCNGTNGTTLCPGPAKVLPYAQCNAATAEAWSFAVYFASKTIPNTIACKATTQELTQQNVQRFEKCSLEAFRLVVKSFVWTLALKEFALVKTMVNDTADSKYQSISDTIYNSLSSRFNDYHWEVYFVFGDSIDSCDVLQTNCITIPFTPAVSSLPASKVIAVWSPKCMMTPHVGKAKDALDTMVKYSTHLYGLSVLRQAMNFTGDLRSAMLAYMIDPPTYVKNANLTGIDDTFGNVISNVNFFSNNVLTVLPKGTTFYAKSDDRSYRSGTGRILTNRSMISEALQQLSDHSVIVSYYGSYDKSNSGGCAAASACR